MPFGPSVGASLCGRVRLRHQKKKKKKTHSQKKQMEKSFFPTSETPKKNFMPLSGEVESHRTLTKNQEHKSHNNSEFERCVPQNT